MAETAACSAFQSDEDGISVPDEEGGFAAEEMARASDGDVAMRMNQPPANATVKRISGKARVGRLRSACNGLERA